MVKSEIYKFAKIKTIFVSLFLVVVTILLTLYVYGGFGYNLNIFSSVISYSEKSGDLITGKEGYQQNKEIALKYTGEVNDLFLKQLHHDVKNSSYVEFVEGKKFYNATYNFFNATFAIDSENYAKKDDIWGNVDGSVWYGFSGDWDAYGNILNNFFLVFSLFIIIIIAPLFAYDRECNMNELLGTAENGGNRLLKYKTRAAFCSLNFLMFIFLIFISIIHFSQYGFDNANVSIQCSLERRFISSTINMNMGQLTLWRLLFGVIGCNMLGFTAILISMLCRTTLASFALTMVITWSLSYPIVQMIPNENIQNILLAVMPINALFATALLLDFPTWYALWGVVIVRFLLSSILFFITIVIWKRNYLNLNKGD
ncbi:MAG: hypothetical protein FWC09_03525 [Lachnospiraceae bacterium]|nr:hypothetical protein [Lachnospiraceae bacterium]